jgi:hypothetical protein
LLVGVCPNAPSMPQLNLSLVCSGRGLGGFDEVFVPLIFRHVVGTTNA